MNLKKYLLLGGVALGLGMSSCVGDLDLEPNDPNIGTPNDPNYKLNSLIMCYSGMACSGIDGPGSSYVGGIDPGTSAYFRVLFTMNEFCTDELVWIWPNDEAGSIGDIVACQWSANNSIAYGAYYRMLGHIAICNDFLQKNANETDPETVQMKAEARVLRAFSYYNMIDLFGQSSFITDEAELGAKPTQQSRKYVFDFIERELKDVIDNNLIAQTPVLGRVGIDGAEGLLARLYLNAEVYTGEAMYDKCAERCENIIARHGGGASYATSGLAKVYHYLFCKDNRDYMPGGALANENEILFGICFDSEMTQSYGGPSFILSGTVTNSHYVARQNYGTSAEWSCVKGVKQMAERFYGADFTNDVRDDLWFRGYLPGGSDANGTWDAEDYSDEFNGFTGSWASTGGNCILKFTNNPKNPSFDPANYDKNKPLEMFKGGYDVAGNFMPDFASTQFASTSQPVIRLADIYLMYAECALNGKGDQTKALRYFNFIRERAGAAQLSTFALVDLKMLMDERSREFYLEGLRRTDLVRAGYFAGPNQTIWQVKGNIDNMAGTRIDSKYNLYPIPVAVLNSQPEFKQNPGY